MAYHNGPRIVTDSLKLCLDPFNTKSYSGSGSTVTDLSGNGNDFTIQGNVSWSASTGFSNFTGNSTGSGNKIYRDNFPTNLKTSQGGNGLTVMAWASSTAVGGWRKLIGNSDGENYIDLYQHSASPYGWHTDGDGATLYYGPGTSTPGNTYVINDGAWKCLWATNLNNGLTSNPTYALTIGNEPNSSPQGSNPYPWIGNIGMVLIYGKVLSTNEMIQNYNATKSRYSL